MRERQAGRQAGRKSRQADGAGQALIRWGIWSQGEREKQRLEATISSALYGSTTQWLYGSMALSHAQKTAKWGASKSSDDSKLELAGSQ
ncbi:hypothetical protein PABG_05491 [Paracoccidioides brasiliensis Pb03]|nr:hypothetical protein PABG_05491 [Paracoccidioides brasiliensis Pb03]